MGVGFSGATWGKVKKHVNKEISTYLSTGATPMGSWNASTNTPKITQGSGSVGQYYDVVTAGKWDGIDFLVGDRVFFAANSHKWERVATGKEQDNTPMVIAFVDQNVSNLPTQRASGKPLVVNDSVKVKSTATLPFTIDGITFDSYSDEAVWNGTAWQEQSYSAGKTNEVRVNNPTDESIDGTGDYQNNINIKIANIIGKNKTLGVSDKTNIIDALNYILGNKQTTDKDKAWKVKADGTWELANIREWLSVSTFSGLTPNNYTLYILTEDVTIGQVKYKKGFYTWDSTNTYVMRGGASEVFTDVTTLPTTDISKDTIYRLGTGSTYIYKYKGSVLPVKPQAIKCMKANVTASPEGLTVASVLVPWNEMTLNRLQNFLGAGDVEMVDAFNQGDFFLSGMDLFDYKDNFSEETVPSAYKLFHNPTQTPNGYLPLSKDKELLWSGTSTSGTITLNNTIDDYRQIEFIGCRDNYQLSSNASVELLKAGKKAIINFNWDNTYNYSWVYMTLDTNDHTKIAITSSNCQGLFEVWGVK